MEWKCYSVMYIPYDSIHINKENINIFNNALLDVSAFSANLCSDWILVCDCTVLSQYIHSNANFVMLNVSQTLDRVDSTKVLR
jgi:hypothetical protein